MTTVRCTEGGRLDVILAEETEFSRSHIKKLVDGGNVYVNGAPAVKAGQAVRSGDELSFEDEIPVSEILPENIPLNVIYEDDSVVVINKGRGLVVHPGAGNPRGTLVNALMYRYGDGLSSAYGAARAGIVHRLDKDTTGLLVAARTDRAHAALAEQFSARTVKKLYRAVLDGVLRADSGTVDAPIGRDTKNRLKMCVTPDGRQAITDYTVLERFQNNCYVEFELHTGRTHQIRVHAAHIHHPVSCDATYGGKPLGAGGQLLHSRSLEFDHPATGKRMSFTAEEPNDFMAVLNRLRNNTKA